MQVNDYYDGLDAAACVERAELNLVVTLGAKISIDGNKWCWLFGENLQDGISGFGGSPYLAAIEFNKAFYAKLPETNHDPA